MTLPRIGIGLPAGGPNANPDDILAVATAAEELGFASVWTFERLLMPAGPDGGLTYGMPATNLGVYDSLDLLAWLAAKTTRVRLGTSVLTAILQPPVVLARRLATLDRLSGGRVVAGIAQGWMPEEFAVSDVPMRRRGAGFEEHIAAMRACWGDDPVVFDGRWYQIPRSYIGPKPGGGRVPLLIGGGSQPAIERAARIGDGFAVVFLGWEAAEEQFAWYRAAGGNGPAVLRVNPEGADLPDPAPPFSGDLPSLLTDLACARTADFDEVILDFNHAAIPVPRQLEIMATLSRSLEPVLSAQIEACDPA